MSDQAPLSQSDFPAAIPVRGLFRSGRFAWSRVMRPYESGYRWPNRSTQVEDHARNLTARALASTTQHAQLRSATFLEIWCAVVGDLTRSRGQRAVYAAKSSGAGVGSSAVGWRLLLLDQHGADLVLLGGKFVAAVQQ